MKISYRKAFVALAAMPLVAAAAQAQSQNWPTFRAFGGVAVGKSPTPATWDVSNSSNVAWRTAIPGIALSSPIVWEDRIYVTTAVPQATPSGQDFRTPHVWKLMSFDRKSGKLVWESTAHEGTPHMDRHPKSSYANSTPSTDGRHIVALYGTDALACFDRSGKLLWKKVISQQNNDPRGGHFGSSPIIVEDLAILQNDRDKDSYIAAYKLQDGTEVWRVNRTEGQGQATPAVAWTTGANRRPLLVVAGRGTLRGLDARSGKEVWVLNATHQYAAESPTMAGDLVVFAAGGATKPVYAIRADSTGDISLSGNARQNNGVVWSTERGGAQITSPLVANGQVYVLGGNGTVTAYDLKDGRQIYQQRAGTGEYYASPVISGDKVYVVNTDGDVTVFRAGPTFEVIARNTMGESTSATPAIIDGTMYVRTNGHLMALRETTKR